MKKLLTGSLVSFILLAGNSCFAQLSVPTQSATGTTLSNAQAQLATAKAKAATAKASATQADSTFKAAKVKAATAKASAKTTVTNTTTTVKTTVNSSAGKVVGKDAKGNTIYQGPKGGQYTLSASGAKQYIKK